jgi:hypothetical protein
MLTYKITTDKERAYFYINESVLILDGQSLSLDSGDPLYFSRAHCLLLLDLIKEKPEGKPNVN